MPESEPVLETAEEEGATLPAEEVASAVGAQEEPTEEVKEPTEQEENVETEDAPVPIMEPAEPTVD